MHATSSEMLDQQGYCIVNSSEVRDLIQDIKHEIDEIGRYFVSPSFCLPEYDRESLTPSKQSLLYDRLPYLASLHRLSGSICIQEMVKSLGIQLPILMRCCNIRLDPPQDYKHLFKWHQDSIYLLGSKNAITLWIPFGKVDSKHGTIQVLPKSHLHGILPFRRISDKQALPNIQLLQRDIELDCDISTFGEPVTIEADLGDVVIFDQSLLHRSLPNLSSQVRLSAQIRISDLKCPVYQKNNFPNGDKTNIMHVDYPSAVPYLNKVAMSQDR